MYHIDLLVAKPTGAFMKQLPSYITLIESPRALLWMSTPKGDTILRGNASFIGIIGKLTWKIRNICGLFQKGLNEEQKLWQNWKMLIPKLSQKYDIAVSYMNGFPNYYLIDKVQADKKVLWIHNEYQKLNYERNYDHYYYNASNLIITISDTCLNSFVDVFPEFRRKIGVLENITNRSEILLKGNEKTITEFDDTHKLKILSVGRLCEQKGFDLAIMAAEILKQKGISFLWIVLGEGPDRYTLQELIDDKGLNEDFKLIGIRENPYVYINKCDIFIQSSRYEGKSIVLDEAKVFCKPIVVTRYPTVYDNITDGKTGIIVDMHPRAIAKGVADLVRDSSIGERLRKNLYDNTIGNEGEIDRYINVMF